ncbi:hypothetical protein CLOSPI_02089 [Thomasclavelia spiroformis DSM 1552]|uniref:Uncharacterized protein n=2 Tax=Thomasclavelia spiroformis TaxID=29348 RepID=B1C4C0_9FIRM|nr:hypothetical protein CLOSPI_02089 [Thomasclavelia spiroformis DSM 1552]
MTYKMNAEDFIEIAEYINDNYISKDECSEIDLYRVLSSIDNSLSDIAMYLKNQLVVKKIWPNQL